MLCQDRKLEIALEMYLEQGHFQQIQDLLLCIEEERLQPWQEKITLLFPKLHMHIYISKSTNLYEEAQKLLFFITDLAAECAG